MDTFTEQFRPWAYHLGTASHRGDALARSLVEGFITNMGRPSASRETQILSDLQRWINGQMAAHATRQANAALPDETRGLLKLKGMI